MAAHWSNCKPTLPASLCLLAVPQPTSCLSLQISVSCSLVPLAYFSVPSQISASFSPPSSFSSMLTWHLPSEAVLACPAHLQQSATPPPHTSSPSLLSASVSLQHRTRFCYLSCSLSVSPPGLCTPHKKKCFNFCLQPKIGASMFKVSW